MPRYAIRIAPDAIQSVSRTAFDPPDNLVFASRDRAEGFCESLNRCLGYQRFIVIELKAEPGARPAEEIEDGGTHDGGDYSVGSPLVRIAGSGVLSLGLVDAAWRRPDPAAREGVRYRQYQ